MSTNIASEAAADGEAGGAPQASHETIMARLKAATAELHRHAETRPFQQALAQGTALRGDFARYLAELLHVHRELEAGLRAGRAEHDAIAGVFRSRHEREKDLRADLAFFDHPAHAEPLPATRELADALAAAAGRTPVALLGALYVLEGSMNGNSYLARALGRSWNLAPGPGLRYLAPYGDAQREAWAAFRADMDACLFTTAEADAIIAFAQRVFTGIASLSEAISETAAPARQGASDPKRLQMWKGGPPHPCGGQV